MLVNAEEQRKSAERAEESTAISLAQRESWNNICGQVRKPCIKYESHLGNKKTKIC